MSRSARTAKCDPARLGCPFTCWSLTKLRDYLAEHKRIKVSRETIRLVLRKAGISFQNTKTWKHSNDPDFAAKLAAHPGPLRPAPDDGRVICIDEFGPLNLMPRPGKGWFPDRPSRSGCGRPSTAPPGCGTCSPPSTWPAAQMFYRIRDRKRWTEFLDFLRQIRRRFPTGRLYVVLDNYGPHKKAQVREWCEANDVELVFTPTNASWMNWIECEFTALRYFALNGSDYPDHDTQNRRDRQLRPLAQQARQTQGHTSRSGRKSANRITSRFQPDAALAGAIRPDRRWLNQVGAGSTRHDPFVWASPRRVPRRGRYYGGARPRPDLGHRDVDPCHVAPWAQISTRLLLDDSDALVGVQRPHPRLRDTATNNHLLHDRPAHIRTAATSTPRSTCAVFGDRLG